jgi:hypothetical protein
VSGRRFVVVCDFNLDGKRDLQVANSPNAASALLARVGFGGELSYTTGAGPMAVGASIWTTSPTSWRRTGFKPGDHASGKWYPVGGTLDARYSWKFLSRERAAGSKGGAFNANVDHTTGIQRVAGQHSSPVPVGGFQLGPQTGLTLVPP